MSTVTFKPKVALALLDAATEATLREAFVTCNVQPVVVKDDPCKRLAKEKFEGCAVPLTQAAAAVVETIRASPSNQRIVIYGVLDEERPYPSLFKLGINVVLNYPLSKRDALTRIRSTNALLIHELRRYVRVPIAVPVKLQDRHETLTLMSREISGGGISIDLKGRPLPEDTVRLSFALPNAAEVNIEATPCWYAGGCGGFQFDDADRAKTAVRRWIESWLGIT